MQVVGLDVSSCEIHVYDDSSSRVGNTKQELRKWALALSEDAVVGMEPTARYHRAAAHAVLEAGRTAYLLNPFQLKRYHDGSGSRTKTDKVDASVAQSYLKDRLNNQHKHKLHPYTASQRDGEPLKDLLEYRETLIDKRAAVRQSTKDLGMKIKKLPKFESGARELLAEVDAMILDQVKQSDRYKRFLKMDGVGPVTGASLTWMFESREFETRNAAVAFAGMDVAIRESGRYKGKAKLTKRGPAIIRRNLYNAANSLRRIEDWKPVFEYYESKGKERIEVTNIVARKLLKIAWGINQSGGSYDRAKALAKYQTKSD